MDFKQLVGRTIKPGKESEYSDSRVIKRIPIKVNSIVIAENVNAVIINGNYIMSMSEIASEIPKMQEKSKNNNFGEEL